MGLASAPVAAIWPQPADVVSGGDLFSGGCLSAKKQVSTGWCFVYISAADCWRVTVEGNCEMLMLVQPFNKHWAHARMPLARRGPSAGLWPAGIYPVAMLWMKVHVEAHICNFT